MGMTVNNRTSNVRKLIVSFIVVICAFVSTILCVKHVKANAGCSNGVCYSDGQGNVAGDTQCVQYLHDNVAVAGDTIMLPSGNYIWSATVTLTQDIVLQGQGVGVTILQDAGNSAPMLKWDYSQLTNARPRLTGIEFQDGGRTAGANSIWFKGSSELGSRFRFDNCKIVNLYGIIRYDDVVGVVDHNAFEQTRAGFPQAAYNYNYEGTNTYGSWAAGPRFGGEKTLFFEDNTFTNYGPRVLTICDGYDGARYVCRYNTLNGFNVQQHGTDTGSGGLRGSVVAEVYDNVFNGFTSANDVCYIRSGAWLIHDNKVSGFGSPGFSIHCDRLHGDLPRQAMGGADGKGVFDVNDPNGGTNNSPVPFYTGTATANSTGATVYVTPSISGSFATGGGYIVDRTTNVGNLNTVHNSPITSNTTSSITYNGTGFLNNGLAFTAGDTVKIYRVIHALDQPGRNGGTFMSGNPPVANGPNDQYSSPCYEWNNHLGAQDPHFTNGETTIHSGVDYFNSTQYAYTPFPHPHYLVGSPTPTPTPFPMTPPSNLTATAVDCYAIDLSWADNSDNEDGFALENSLDNIKWSQFATVGPDITTYHKTLLYSGVHYYRVRGFVGANYSTYSNVASADTSPLCPTPTPTPTLCVVPNLIGLHLRDTQAAWNEAGFTTDVVYDGRLTPNAGNTIISYQSIAAGTEADCDTTIIHVD